MVQSFSLIIDKHKKIQNKNSPQLPKLNKKNLKQIKPKKKINKNITLNTSQMDPQQSQSHEQDQLKIIKKKQQQAQPEQEQSNENQKINQDSKIRKISSDHSIGDQGKNKKEQQDSNQDENAQQQEDVPDEKQVDEKDNIVVEEPVDDLTNNNQNKQHQMKQSKRDCNEKLLEQQNNMEQQQQISKTIKENEHNQIKQQSNAKILIKDSQQQKQQQSQKPLSSVHNQILQQQQQNGSLQSGITESQKLRYINSLENTLRQREQQIQDFHTQSKVQLDKISQLQLFKTSLQRSEHQKTQQTAQLSHRCQLFEEESESNKQKIKELQQLLISYRELGDITMLQARQGLIRAQTQQISIMKENEKSEMVSEQSILFSKEYRKKIQQYQQKKQQCQAKIKQMEITINKKSKENTENNQIMNVMDQKLKDNLQKIQTYEEQLKNQKKDRQNQRTIYESKIKDLQKYIKANSNNLCMNQKQFQEKQRNDQEKQDQTLMIKQQKDIVFRQYLRLEIQFKNLQQTTKEFKNKYQQTIKQLKNVKKDMISKKDYEEIVLKYKKCKTCLEKAIKQNKLLRCNGNDANGQLQVRGANNILNEQQKNMKQYLQVLNNHIKQSIGYEKQSKSIMQNIRVEKLQQQLTKKQKMIKEIEQKNESLENLNTIIEKQLVYKNQLMERIIEDSKNIKNQYFKLQKRTADIQHNVAENITAKNALERLQAKSANLIRRNRAIVAEKDHWKSLYQQLKNQYEAFLAKDLNKQNKSNGEKGEKKRKCSNNMVQEDIQSEQRKIKKTYQTEEIQTEGLTQLYFKQIKQVLSTLRKSPQTMRTSITIIQQIKQQLQSYKKKYEQLNNKFNIKFKTLQNQKNENELWRQNMKKQIISQFQDIRQLIENNRLLDCLRKAKNLIEGLQQQEEEEGEVSG